MIKLSIQLALCLFLLAISCLKCSVSKKKSSVGTNKTTEGQAQIASNQALGKASSNDQLLQGSWQFDNFTMVNTSKNILFPMDMPFLNFDLKGKKFSGTAGCNNISGRFVMNGENLSFTQPFIMTRMSCNAMGEKIFVDYLNSIKRFVIVGNNLQLISDSKPVIIMKRVVK